MTFGTLLTAYIASLDGRPSQEKYRQLQKQFFDVPIGPHPWRDKSANAITRYDLLALRQHLKTTPAHANKVLGLVRQAYHWGLNTIDDTATRPVYDGPNPTDGIQRYTTKSREVMMDTTQIARVLDSLDFLDAKYQAWFTLRLTAPGRIKELCDMRWEDLDLTVGKWTKPITKNGRRHLVPLPTQAVDALLKYRESCPHWRPPLFVFRGIYGRSLRPESARKVWVNLRRDLNLEQIWLLDFRRTLASYLYMVVKADVKLVKAMLNHYDGTPTAVYTRLTFDYLRPLMQNYADWLWAFKGRAHHDHPASQPGTVDQSPWTGVQPNLYLV